jgi:hypothetical protein
MIFVYASITMKIVAAFLLVILSMLSAHAQPVTGVWRGKVVRGNPPFATTYKLEVKLIKQGDSLTGTSYYYANANNFYRYSIKGFLDPVDASIHWWDENLLEKKGGTSVINPLNSEPLAMQTDFNCPGGGTMMLDGSVETKAGNEMTVHLDKQEQPLFSDDWDALIENWFYGGADPDLIAQAEAQQQLQKNDPPPAIVLVPAPSEKKSAPPIAPPAEKKAAPPVANPAPEVLEKPVSKPAPVPTPTPLTTQQKWETRQRVTQTTLPIAGDSIELQFFDNAEIDGDSISLFLNGKLIFEHVRLSAEPFVLKLAVAYLSADSELAMVAENLGSIPPNTSFMMAYVQGERYTARLESTEKTTAVIRFQKVATLATPQ